MSKYAGQSSKSFWAERSEIWVFEDMYRSTSEHDNATVDTTTKIIPLRLQEEGRGATRPVTSIHNDADTSPQDLKHLRDPYDITVVDTLQRQVFRHHSTFNSRARLFEHHACSAMSPSRGKIPKASSTWRTPSLWRLSSQLASDRPADTRVSEVG